MRHLLQHRKLGRTSEHRRALRRNLAQSLFEHGQIVTTLPKAKDVRPFVERLVTLAKKAHTGDLAALRRLVRLMNDRGLIGAEHREKYEMMSDAGRQKTMRARSGRRHRTGDAKAGLEFTAESVLHRLINTVAPRYLERPGGYTRIVKLARRRIGDNGERAMLQLVGDEQKPGHVTKPKKTARQKRIERLYAAAARAGKSAKTKEPPKEKTAAPKSDPESQAPPAEAPAREEPGDQE